VDLEAIHKAVYGEEYGDLEIGRFKHVLMARATDSQIKERAQTGGVVSTLMDFAVREGVIDAALLTSRDGEHLPEGRIAHDREEILACAGSSYVAGPTLEVLNRGPWDQDARIGIVAIPCQGLALANMRMSQLESKTPIERIALIIGLFCTWALNYGPFMAFIRNRVNGAEILKMDITPPPERLLKVTTDEATLDVPLDEIREFIRPTCGVCMDMTSEFSDLSVGTVEGTDGWNTVIVRTDRGEELLNRAENAGVLEVEPLGEANFEHLKEASLLKKKRALDALKDRGEPDAAYVKLSGEMVQRIHAEPKEVSS
jgi:coenzyme F420 hydrogenase subunit beta